MDLTSEPESILSKIWSDCRELIKISVILRDYNLTESAGKK